MNPEQFIELMRELKDLRFQCLMATISMIVMAMTIVAAIKGQKQ